jgi:molybdate transport system substrate-binding protein
VTTGRGLVGDPLTGVATMATDAEIAVFAAGSLRAPFTDLSHEFERVSGRRVVLTFGASGLLRDRIERGEGADVFASANMEHPQSLATLGWTTRVERFARNRMCLIARAGFVVTTESALDVMLDPKIKLGTSTPKADPSGDYAWEVFGKAEAIRPGAFEALSGKALKLTSGAQSPTPPERGSIYGMLLSSRAADLFLTYCTNAEAVRREIRDIGVVRLPASLEVGADYGLAVRRDASSAASEFAAFLRWAEGQRVLAAYGFDPP